MNNLAVTDIKPAPYNPRKISEEELRGLKTSMDKFGNIAGITYNKRTGNLVTGHHRWDILNKDFDDLFFDHLRDDIHSINSKAKGFTGYLIRIVDWDKSVEKAANVAANSQQLAGKFIPEILSEVLEEIKIEMPELMEELRFDVLAEEEIKVEKVPKSDYSGSNVEINTDNFGNDLEHSCPRCGFQFND